MNRFEKAFLIEIDCSTQARFQKNAESAIFTFEIDFLVFYGCSFFRFVCTCVGR